MLLVRRRQVAAQNFCRSAVQVPSSLRLHFGVHPSTTCGWQLAQAASRARHAAPLWPHPQTLISGPCLPLPTPPRPAAGRPHHRLDLAAAVQVDTPGPGAAPDDGRRQAAHQGESRHERLSISGARVRPTCSSQKYLDRSILWRLPPLQRRPGRPGLPVALSLHLRRSPPKHLPMQIPRSAS